MESNPLKKYFRQPAIYIRLPSQGQFYPDGALAATTNNEYPVLPMTTLDEITYRTPDALFNGQAVCSVIESCVPNIRDAWSMPSMDIDTVLVAIRIATYGHELEISTRCPKCEHESDFGLDLRTVMDKVKSPDYTQPMVMGDLTINFRPMSYKELNDNSMRQFEEQKTLQMMQESQDGEEEKLRQLSEILKKITQVTTKALAQNILSVQTTQCTVHEQEHISEWLSNCDRATFSRIRDHIIATKQSGEVPPLKIKCTNCANEFDQIFTLDMSNFFVDAS
jgi:hypothetical protein